MSKTPQDKGPGDASAAAAGADSFHVAITASGRANLSPTDSRLVHAVSITQQVQSWTVVRDHVDFVAVGHALSSVVAGLPACPAPPSFDSNGGGSGGGSDLELIVNSRNALQEWLAAVLLYPGARESPAVRQFLCFGANVVPPQFENVGWVSFNDAAVQEQQARHASASSSSQVDAHESFAAGAGEAAHVATYADKVAGRTGSHASAGHGHAHEHHHGGDEMGEMDMDDMFGYGGEDHHQDEDEEEDYGTDEDDHSEDAEYYDPQVRYQPHEEAITTEDAMELGADNEVEMVEDVGSLAQSMGASHLGRSLQLQAQLSHGRPGAPAPAPRPSQGLTIGGAAAASSGATGGIGGAMAQAGGMAAAIAAEQIREDGIEGIGDSFRQAAPVSPPSLESFKLIKVIGKGSFGKVFLVREKQTGEMFALKVLTKDNIIRRNQVEHTKTERSVLGYVKHPFVVGLRMAFQSKDKLYFVLDYCAGGELFFHLGKLGKFPEPRACFYTAEIILAIEYVHSLDIIYRDLKPENVLLDAKGHVRLTDFGLSKEGISNSSSGAHSFCGTPEYLAPEILNRQGHGRAVDWWSLGALLYEMLTGLPPFYCRDREKLFEKIRHGELGYPRYLSTKAVGALRGLLTRDPTKRLGSGPRDAEDIKEQPFFGGIDWVKLTNGEVPAPWDPQISGSLDTSQFDNEFTSMPMFSPQSMQQGHGFGGQQAAADDVFAGFTFTDRGYYGPQHAS